MGERGGKVRGGDGSDWCAGNKWSISAMSYFFIGTIMLKICIITLGLALKPNGNMLPRQFEGAKNNQDIRIDS